VLPWASRARRHECRDLQRTRKPFSLNHIDQFSTTLALPRSPTEIHAPAPDSPPTQPVRFPTRAVECKMFRSARESISVRGYTGERDPSPDDTIRRRSRRLEAA